MAELYRFFDGTVSDPRSYSADDFAEYFRQFIRNGVFNGGDELQVSSQQVGLKTYVKPGKAWINGYFYKNTDNLFLDHNVSHATMDRIDRVVLRLDYDLRTMGVKVLTGVPGVTPQPPALTRNNHVYELSLAQVKIKAGAVSVSPADIVDERFDTELCGLVTHLFEQVDTTEIFAQFTAEWRQWFEEVKDVTNLVPRSEAFLFMSIPQFQQAVQNPFLMEQMAQEFLALDVITSNPTAMDIIASSEVAMEAVAASEVAMEAIFDSWLARLAIWESEMASQTIIQKARAWLEANVMEEAYRQSNSSEFAMVVNKKGLLLAIRHDNSTAPTSPQNGEMQVFAQAPTARSYTDIVGGSLEKDTWYDVAYRMENFQVKNRQSGTQAVRLDFRYVPMEP